MTSPVDKIINELTELATGLYDFLLRTEGRPERVGWMQQLEQCRKRVLSVRLLAGQRDYRGLHDACMIQQEYLNALLADPYSPTSLDWEHLERWPLLVLPCIATPLSHEAVDELVDYCCSVGVPLARKTDRDELRENLLDIATPTKTSARVVSLPYATRHSAILEAPVRTPVNEEISVRYLLQRELLDALAEYSDSGTNQTAEALRLCADRIQLLGFSAAGAGWTGLMDCCLLCHDTLLRRVAQGGILSDEENGAFKTWTGLLSRYLETPQVRAGIDALIEFYQRAHFIEKMTGRDYENLLEALIRDGAAEPTPSVIIEAVAQTAAKTASGGDQPIESAIERLEVLVDPVAGPVHEIELQLKATQERDARLQQLASDMTHCLAGDAVIQPVALVAYVQSLTEISNEYYLASQSAQMHINTLRELITAGAHHPYEPVAGVAASPAAATSLVHALLIRSGAQMLAVSIHGIDRVFHAGSGEIVGDGHRLHYCVDEMRYEACELETLLQLPVDRAWLNDAERSAILVYDIEHAPHVVFVEEVLAAQELEVKPIGPYMPRFPGVIGVTLLTSGELAPVIDLPDLLRMTTHPEAALFAMASVTEPGEYP